MARNETRKVNGVQSFLLGVQQQQQRAKARRAERGGNACLSVMEVSLIDSAEMGICRARVESLINDTKRASADWVLGDGHQSIHAYLFFIVISG